MVAGVQLVFGLSIPILLIPHIFATRVARRFYGIQNDYTTILAMLWPHDAGASRRLLSDKYHYYTRLTSEQVAALDNAISISVWTAVAIIAIAYRLVRTLYGRLGPTVRVTYAHGPSITNQIGPTLLDISRIHGIPHASVCGGRARCSTCSVRVMEGLDNINRARRGRTTRAESCWRGIRKRGQCSISMPIEANAEHSSRHPTSSTKNCLK
ncbi:MAG: ferredoxin [Granulosicoccus sp.]|jgi:ferredoxin